MRFRRRASTISSPPDNFYDHVDGFNASTMVVPSKGPAYILLKDTVGLKRAKRRIGVRFGSQTIFTAHAGAIYLGNKDDKQPADKTMISLVSLTDSKRILVTLKENTRQLSTAELKMMLPITSDQRRAKILSSTVFMEAITAQIDDIVTITDGELQAVATIKYVGQLPWKQHGGVYLGVEFEEAIGDSDGCELFETEENRGKFISVDKIDKFIVKNEKTRYALTNDAIDKSSQQNGENHDHQTKKINKRLSFPIMSTLARIKPKLKTTGSLQDLSIGSKKDSIKIANPNYDHHQQDDNSVDNTDSVAAVRLRRRHDSSDETSSKHSSSSSSTTDSVADEPIYAVSADINIDVGHLAESESEVKEVKKAEMTEKQKKAHKRMSFPISLSSLVPNFPAMPKMRSRSKSLESVNQLDVENPYYATSSDIGLEAAPVFDPPPPEMTQLDCPKPPLSPRLSGIVESDEDEPVLCFNHGCDIQVTKDKLEKHQAVCKFALQICPNDGCELSMRRSEINKHDFVECEYALVKCKTMGCNARLCRKMMNQHISVCHSSGSEKSISVKQNPEQDTYEMMGAGESTINPCDDDVIYASSHSLKCPAPRCCFQGDESNLCDHICSQHSDLILRHLTELRSIFTNKEAEKDLSYLYTKPIKKVAPTPRPRKPSLDDKTPVYSTPSTNNNNSKKVVSKNISINSYNSVKANTVDYSEQELPVYSTPDQQSTRNTDVHHQHDNEYLAPVDSNTVAIEHVYLTPVDDKTKARTNSFKVQNPGQYEYVAFQVKT